MLSRIGRIIECIGFILVAVSFIWLVGVAGMDEYTAVSVIIGKAVIGLLGMGLGVALMNRKGR